MTRKQAFLRRSKYSFYNRNIWGQWLSDYNEYQLEWLFKHRMVKWSEPKLHLGENPKNKYIEFTKKGEWWHDWYSFTLWEWIMVFVFKKYLWKHLWHKFMIAMGHHYKWQEYDER